MAPQEPRAPSPVRVWPTAAPAPASPFGLDAPDRKLPRFSIRWLIVLSSLLLVAAAIALPWAITLSFGLRNVNALTDSIVLELSQHARDRIVAYLVEARDSALRSRDDFASGRLTQRTWREVYEALDGALQRNAGLFSTYVRFADVTGLGVNRCEPQHTDCPLGTRVYAHNATHMVFYGVGNRAQPIALAQGQNQLPFRVLPGDWYDKARASPSGAAWSDLDYTPITVWTRLERLRVIFSAAFAAPAPLACTAGAPLPPRFPYPHGLSPAPPPSCAETPAPAAGAVRTIIKVDALSRLLGEIGARLPGSTFFLTTGEGKMVAVDSASADELLDGKDAPLVASASPTALTRALYANFLERGAAAEGSGAGLRVGGRPFFFGHTAVRVAPDLGWTLHVGVPEDVVLAEINRGTLYTTVANSLWLAACVGIAAAVGLLITRPLAVLHARLALLLRTLTDMARELREQAGRAAPARSNSFLPSPREPPPGTEIAALEIGPAADSNPPPAAKRRRWWPWRRRVDADAAKPGGRGGRRPSPEPGELRSALAELATFAPLVADVQAGFLSFLSLVSRETAVKLEAEARVRASRRFVAMVSHEIRNPLNVLLGVVQLAREARGVPADVAEDLGAALEAGRHLLFLVGQVLDLEGIESGAGRRPAVPFAVREAAASAARLLGPALRARGVALAVEVEEDVPPAVLGDPDGIRQLLFNLLSNVAKYGEGPAALRVRRSEDPPGLRFEVADSGPGIAKEHQSHLFDRFYRVPLARIHGATGDPGGAGLGLAICRELVERLTGEIACESAPGCGSTFWFRLPLPAADLPVDVGASDEKPVEAARDFLAPLPAPPAAAPATLEPPPPPPAAPPPPPGEDPPTKRDVLVVDDIEMNRKVLGAFVNRAGHRPHAAADGSEAVAAFRERAEARRGAPGPVFDLIFMDIAMCTPSSPNLPPPLPSQRRRPVLDGLSATRGIREAEAELGVAARTPICACTAFASESDRSAALAAGMDDFCPKPVMRAAVLRVLEKWLAAPPELAIEGPQPAPPAP